MSQDVLLATPAASAAHQPPRHARLAVWLWLALAIFTVYGALAPFDMVWDRRLATDKLSLLTLNPFLAPGGERRASLPDVAQNVMLFAPFGLLGVLALGGRGRFSPARVLLVTVLAALLSATTETLQLFTVDRITSVSDLFFDTLGACGGALCGGACLRSVRWVLKALRVSDTPAFYPLLVATLVLCVAAWQPFDVTIEVGRVWADVKAFRTDPWQVNGLSDEGLEFLRYLLFTATVSVWLRQFGVRAPRRITAIVGVTAAFGLESSQFFFESRTPGLEDALVHSAGALAGVGAAASAGRFGSPSVWVVLLALSTWIGAAMQALGPFTLAPVRTSFASAALVAYRGRVPLEGLSHFIEIALAYFPLGFALPLTLRRRSEVWTLSAAIPIALTLPIVYCQGWIVGRQPDISDVAVAAMGGLAGAWACGVGFVRFTRWLGSDGFRQPGPRRNQPAIRTRARP